MITVILFLKNSGKLQEIKALEKENALRSSAGQPTNVELENASYQKPQTEGEVDATKDRE